MLQLKNKQLLYAGIGVTLAFAVSMLFVLNLYAESENHFKRSAYSSETKNAIYTAFENSDYDAYAMAVTEKNKQFILTEEEFNSHVQKIAKKQQIRDALTADDYDVYLQLTDGSIHQLSEAAFHKKSKMLALKEEIKTALEGRDYTSFTQKKQALKELLGDEHVSHKRYGESEEMTEEQFNMLADRAEQYGTEYGDFAGKKQRGYHNKHGKSPHHSW